MMLSSRQTRRAQRAVFFAGLVLVVFYLSIFRPMTHRAASRNVPLGATWEKLARAGIRSDQDHHLNLAEIEDNLKQVKHAAGTVEKAGRILEASVAANSTVRQRMSEPFQLVDFQIEELLRIEEIGRMARHNRVEISSSVFSNYPEYRADRDEPEVLWGQLAFLHQVLEAAVECKVSLVEKIELPPHVVHRDATNAPVFLYEIPVDVELQGSMESISKLLSVLPRRAEPGKATDTAPALPAKPALFLERILLVKNSPENPDQAHLQLRVCGFIFKDW